MDKISNWRYDLREVEGVPEDISNSKPTTDLKSKREVKEKTVNNKVTINPPLGDKMEGVIASMGGKLISISEEGKCDGCTCKGCGPGGVGHKIPCAKCGGTHKEKVDEATYPGHDEKGNPLKPKDNRYRVSNADKKANTPAWQKYKSGDKNYTKFDHVDEGYVDKKKSEVIKALTKKKDKFVKKYGKDAPDVMYAVAAKTAKKKGDTSKSDDRYAYEEVQLEGFKEDEIETMRAQHKAREEQKKKLPQYKPVPLKRSGKNTSSDSDRDRLAKSVRGENIPGFKGGRLD